MLDPALSVQAAVQYPVEGSEKMGNGIGLVLRGLAALTLPVALPTQSLMIRDLFPGDTVTFPFDSLSKDVRRELEACFRNVRRKLAAHNAVQSQIRYHSNAETAQVS